MLRLERKRNVVPVLNYAVRHEGTWGSGGRAPHILISDLDVRELTTFRFLFEADKSRTTENKGKDLLVE
jgi:hypothetical protein